MEIIIDYAPIKGCNNPNTYGAICVKCNKCGRFENKKESESDEQRKIIEKCKTDTI